MRKTQKDAGFIYNVQVVNRVLDMLETLATKEEGLRLTELASQLDLPFSTTHRLVTLMVRRGYVEQDLDSRRYFMGLKVLELRGQLLRRLRVTDQARPFMRELMQETGELVHLAVLIDGEMAYINSLEGPRTPFMSAPIGYRAPVHCTSLGKAFLAYLPETEVKAIIREKGLKKFTANTIVTLKGLLAELEQVRSRGYAVDDMEQHEGLRCLGAPVFNDHGQVVAGISVAGPSARMTPEKDTENGKLVLRAANSISARLGYSESLGKPARKSA